jgi:hypothetical protein
VTLSVDDETPSLRSVWLWITRQSVARLVVFRCYADPETLWVSLADRPYVALPDVGPLLCVVLPLCPLFCMAEVSSLYIFCGVDITRKMPARYGRIL